MTAMSKTYFITLTPYDLYFFGGEQNERADYYLKGNPNPQQTALLGMVRYQILDQNGLLENNKIKDDDAAKEWIGADSFKHDISNQGFGKIVSISPCYIVEKTSMKKYLPTYPVYMKGWKCVCNNYFLPAYDPKKEYPLRWKHVGSAEVLGEDRKRYGEKFSYYKGVERVGVDKNSSGATDIDGFFKQVWLKMDKDFAFGFYLTLEEDVILRDADVSLGKENSSFQMTVKTENAPDSFQEKQQGNALVLTSDAYVNPDFFMKSKCSFAVCDTIPFRNLANKTSSSHEHYRGEKNKKRIQLLKRGSVFIADNIDEVADELKKHNNFYKIGYNTFQIIQIDGKL
jgi:CRISPR-associated protein Cmr3